jgi:hypothetical protein
MVGILGSQCNRKNGVGQKLFFQGQISPMLVKVVAGNGLREVSMPNLTTRSSNLAADRLTHTATRI